MLRPVIEIGNFQIEPEVTLPAFWSFLGRLAGPDPRGCQGVPVLSLEAPGKRLLLNLALILTPLTVLNTFQCEPLHGKTGGKAQTHLLSQRIQSEHSQPAKQVFYIAPNRARIKRKMEILCKSWLITVIVRTYTMLSFFFPLPYVHLEVPGPGSESSCSCDLHHHSCPSARSSTPEPHRELLGCLLA